MIMNKELLKEIKNDNLYDYISLKGYTLTKEDLITLVKELSYAVYELHDRDISNKVNNTMIKKLKRERRHMIRVALHIKCKATP